MFPTAKTPPSVPTSKAPPPRINAPGPDVVDAPARQLRSPVPPNNSGAQSVDSGTQSATHSQRLPTMSKAPASETQLLREPVLAGSSKNEKVMLQSVV